MRAYCDVSSMIYGNYELLTRLATGGMAQIYLARQMGPDGAEKLLVVKQILPHLSENEEFIRMFLDEARIAARLDHPNIVQILDLGAQGDSYFIAMEYIHGEDIRRVWKHAESMGKSIPGALVCRVIIDACAGLDYAHKKTDQSGRPLGIVHRDISPQNILVTFEGGVKVVDFGIAKAADQATVTRSGVLKGKYSYMSPEQASGKRVDCRSDIFALGVVLYELLTGTRLFKRETEIQTLRAVMGCEVVAPSVVNDSLPSTIDPIVMRALTKNPNDRYQEAVEFQVAIEQWLLSQKASSSSMHLAAFMGQIYAERLAREAASGQIFVEQLELPQSQQTDTSSNQSKTTPDLLHARVSAKPATAVSRLVRTEVSRTQTRRRRPKTIAIGFATMVLSAGVLGYWSFYRDISPAVPIETPNSVATPASITTPTIISQPVLDSPTLVVSEDVAADKPNKSERKREPITHGQQQEFGFVRIAVKPVPVWADVTCGEHQLGQTPFPDVQLPVGDYECRFTNPELGTRIERVVVRANEKQVVTVSF